MAKTAIAVDRMKAEKVYFNLSIEQLRSLARWAADCAERSLTIYEESEMNDDRPRHAIDGARAFVMTGKRNNVLRKAALDAHRASMQAKHEAASAAAKAASLAAASAFTHPFSDLHQAMHILGPAAYAALAIELSQNGDTAIGAKEIEWAVSGANRHVAELLNMMPEQTDGSKRINQLLQMLDRGLRARFK
nr:hypothetical protein [uncultured Dyadobacter sp.]